MGHFTKLSVHENPSIGFLPKKLMKSTEVPFPG